MTDKEEFIKIYTENIHREGSDKLLDFLENKSDFFTAPASTRYHNAFVGGLLRHSLNVYHCLKAYMARERVQNEYGLKASDESIAIAALLHDVCKVNFYRMSYRNVKNEKTGQWEKAPYFEINDTLPYGHGEKSVYMISGYMRLTREEALAIRWHMGFSGTEDKFTIGKALETYPFAFALSVADMEASYFLEGADKKEKE